MIPARHRIPLGLLTTLAEGGSDADAIRLLGAADLSRRLLLIRGVVELSRRMGHARQGLVSEAYELLAAVQQVAPKAVDEVLRYPAVGLWAWHTVRGLMSGWRDERTDPAGLALVAGAAAVRAGFGCRILVPVTEGAVTLPSLGRAIVGGCSSKTSLLCCEPGGTEIIAGHVSVSIPDGPERDTANWRGLRVISAEAEGENIRLIIDDLDPYRMPGPLLRGRLTEAETDSWARCLADAWHLVIRSHRTVAGEVAEIVRVMTPLAASPGGGQVSASSRETYGCIGVSSATSPIELAVTLAHEIQHSKLFVIDSVEPLTLPEDGSRFYAPWRTDPRPLSGLLQGAYAYLGVAGFWRRQRLVEDVGKVGFHAHVEFARWRIAVAQVAGILLGSHRLTGAGEAFVGCMAQVAGAWCEERVAPEAAALASEAAARHARRWT